MLLALVAAALAGEQVPLWTALRGTRDLEAEVHQPGSCVAKDITADVLHRHRSAWSGLRLVASRALGFATRPARDASWRGEEAEYDARAALDRPEPHRGLGRELLGPRRTRRRLLSTCRTVPARRTARSDGPRPLRRSTRLQRIYARKASLRAV